MPFALMILAAVSGWVPARWNSGDPQSLDRLRGGVVNCILVEPQNWNPPFLEAAKRHHIAIFGLIRTVADARRAARLKIDGVALEGEFDPAEKARIRAAAGDKNLVELPGRGEMRLDSGDRVVGTWQGLWPGIEIEHGGGAATAGPTSTPWINTNTGFLRFARAATDSAIWIGEKPPAGVAFPTQRYSLAVADAAMAGARWIVALDSDLERRLLAGESQALGVWRQIEAQIRYWDNPAWREYRP